MARGRPETMKNRKEQITFWAGVAITLFFVGWALLSYDFAAVLEALRGADYVWIIPAAVIEVLLIYIRAVRWHYFLEPIKKVSHYNSFMATSVGFLANMALPARVGEFVRAWVLGKKESISKSASMGTVVIERAIDGLSVVAVILIVFYFVEVPEEKAGYWRALRTAGYTVCWFYTVVFALLFLFHRRVRWVEFLVNAALRVIPARFRPRAGEMLESFRDGFNALENGRHLFAIFAWSVVFWAVAGGLNIAFFYAFGLGHLPFIATYLVLMAQVIGVMVPSPGFVGPYHAATMAALAFYGVGEELGLSVAIVMHATMFLTNIAPGMVFLWLEKMSFSEIRDASEKEA